MNPPARATRGLALGLLVALGLLLLVGRLAPGRPPRAGHAGTASSVAGPSSTTRAPQRGIVARVVFPDTVSGLAVTPGAVWAVHGQAISRVDSTTMRQTAVTGWKPAGGQQLLGIAADPSGVWATVFDLGVLRIDPASAKVVARIRVETEQPPAVGAGGVWVVCCGGDTQGNAGRLVRIDPATNRVRATIKLPGLPDAVGADAGGVWVRGALGGIWRVDPATNRVVATIRVPGGLGSTRGGVLVGRAGVWVSDPDHATVYQIDPRRARLLDARFEADGNALAQLSDGTAWVRANGMRLIGLGGQGPVRTIVLSDPNNNRVTALAAGPQALWAGTDTGTLVRINPAAAAA
jgi:hypothetical protein